MVQISIHVHIITYKSDVHIIVEARIARLQIISVQVYAVQLRV